MRKAIVINIIFLLCLASSLSAQPKDVTGWNNTRWGMTVDEVIKTLKGKAELVDKPNKTVSPSKLGPVLTLARITNIEINAEAFQVFFHFDEIQKKLVRVVVSSKENAPPESQFISLENMLMSMYGKPASSEDNKDPTVGGTFKRSWIFPSTTVEIQYGQFKNLGMNMLMIIYTKN